MKVLLTGATGYIGQRLLPFLVEEGHEVLCCVRDRQRFELPDHLAASVRVLEVDLLKPETLENIPEDIDIAYYLVHSMSASGDDFQGLEERSATHFRDRMNAISVEQVIYLSGIVNEEELSAHLSSRKRVEEILGEGDHALTTLRAGIIIGSGSASYEIIRDLVEKLPVMVAPKWLRTRCQPIAVRDVIRSLVGVLGKAVCYHRDFDIGGPDILTYKEMLKGYAKARGLKRSIITVPVMSPRLSSYWLYFVTNTSFHLATSLVDSMKVEVVCRDKELEGILGITSLSYEEAIQKTLEKVQEDHIPSSWKDAFISGRMESRIADLIEVPVHGCFKDSRDRKVRDSDRAIDRIWSLGGDTGWYYATWLWKLRGWMDKLFGGIGLRKGRTRTEGIRAGDALDFWRVLYADRSEGRLLLFAEMKLPGEAWLEFRLREGVLYQTATFRPKGVGGRLYWWSVLPFHSLIFGGMLKRLSA